MERLANSTTNSLEVTQLSFTYHGWGSEQPYTLFEDLSFSIQTGRKTLLLAPFDAGKSTLARILVGGIPAYFPGTLTGTIHLAGNDIAEVNIFDLVEEVTLVTQNPQEQFVASTVEEEVAFALESMGLPQREMKERVHSALTHWNLFELRSASPGELSGGERKRVLLAAAEAIDAPFWILDEPFDDLDEEGRVHLARVIKESDKTILLFSSRYLQHFDGLFDQSLLLDQKRIVQQANEDALTAFTTLCGDDELTVLKQQTPLQEIPRVLRVEHLTVERQRFSTTMIDAFHLEVPALTVAQGEIVSLVGPNGSGKSSLSRVLCGLDEPLGGRRMIDGEVVNSSVLNRRVGYLFQNPDLQIFLPTVKEELAYSLKRIKGISSTTIEQRVQECAKLFDLNLDHTPSTMSYPKRKALQAAVYYLLDRPFYILDELDSALTYQAALKIITQLRGRGAGILVITHDQRFISYLNSRVYAIKDGRLSEV
ncbi:MAG: ABC transporter ATP-binding protein [Sphaerochaeta sp.]